MTCFDWAYAVLDSAGNELGSPQRALSASICLLQSVTYSRMSSVDARVDLPEG